MTSKGSLTTIALIVALALALRLWGIDWGLPNTLHYFSYHPDETVMLLHSTNRLNPQGLNVFAGHFLPHFYNYGSLQLVLINIVTSIVSAYASAAPPDAIGQAITPLYLAGRVLTAFMGAGTVWALWALGRRLYSEHAGALAALLLALTPLHAQHSHFMTVDVPATLWVVLTLLWCARALTDRSKVRALVFAGCFAGLAIATKYNCALVFLSVAAAAFTRTEPRPRQPAVKSAARALIALAAMTGAYLVACPGTIFESSDFIRDVKFEAIHVSSAQELWFQGTGNGWWYIVSRNLSDGLGAALLVASGAGSVYAAYRRRPGDVILLAFALPYFLVVGAAASRYARYEIPLLPILALLAARVLTEQELFRTSALNAAARWLTVFVAASTAVSAVLLLIPLGQTDPRDRAAAWLATNLPASSNISMPVEPWFWSPPLSPYFSLPGVGMWAGYANAAPVAARLQIDPAHPPAPFDAALLLRQKPPVVVMSEYEYFDRLRLKDPAALEYMVQIKRYYGQPIVFSDVPWSGFRHSIDGLPCEDLPHDMLYTSPTILIFELR